MKNDQKIAWLIAIALTGWLFYLLAPVLVPFVASALLAYLGDPLADRLQKLKLPRTLAVATVFVLTFLVLALLVLLVGPLIANLTQLLRDELNKLDGEYASRHAEGLKRLEEDSSWQQLEPEQRYQLMSDQFLQESARPKVEVQSTSDVLTTLDNCALSMFADRVAAMPARFDNVASGAANSVNLRHSSFRCRAVP